MPSNRMAWSHLLGGSAFVKMSADCMSVWTYSIKMCSLSSCSAMHARFTLWVRWTQRSLDEKPFFATRIVAWLSSWILRWNGLSKISSHKLSAGNAYADHSKSRILRTLILRLVLQRNRRPHRETDATHQSNPELCQLACC